MNIIQLWKTVTTKLGKASFNSYSPWYLTMLHPLMSSVVKVSLNGEARRASTDASDMRTSPYTERRSSFVKFYATPSTMDASFRLTHHVRFRYLSSGKFWDIWITESSDRFLHPHRSKNSSLWQPDAANAWKPESAMFEFA